MWPHLSSVGRQQKMRTLSHPQSHVWIDYVSDIIMCLLQFPFQEHWLFLPLWMRSANLYPPMHSKWKSVKLDVISWLIDLKCNVRLAHSSICTVCGKGKGTEISVLGYCRLERVPGGWGSHISVHLAHEGGQVVSPTYTPSLPSQKIFVFSFLSWAKLMPGT